MLITLVNSHYEISFAAQSETSTTPPPSQNSRASWATGPILTLSCSSLSLTAKERATRTGRTGRKVSSGFSTVGRQIISKADESASRSFRKNLEDLREAVSRRVPKDFADELEAHFEHMPERYFQMFDSEQIAGHVRLFRTFLEMHLTREDPPPYAPVFKWIARPEQGHSEVWVCGWNRPRLLERIAGAFLSAQINILSADVFTRGDNLALDIFRVCSTQLTPVTSARDITRVETRLCDSLAFEDYDFSPLLNKDALLRTYRISQEAEIPTKIVVDNTSHPSFTLIDLQTPDRLGLLYDLLRALGEKTSILSFPASRPKWMSPWTPFTSQTAMAR